jgi:hypothetical protein
MVISGCAAEHAEGVGQVQLGGAGEDKIGHREAPGVGVLAGTHHTAQAGIGIEGIAERDAALVASVGGRNRPRPPTSSPSKSKMTAWIVTCPACGGGGRHDTKHRAPPPAPKALVAGLGSCQWLELAAGI